MDSLFSTSDNTIDEIIGNINHKIDALQQLPVSKEIAKEAECGYAETINKLLRVRSFLKVIYKKNRTKRAACYYLYS